MEVRFGWSYGKFRKTMGLRNRDCTVQYVVLGPRLKVINLNVLPESSCNELKYSLKIAFMFLSIILKFQVPDMLISKSRHLSLFPYFFFSTKYFVIFGKVADQGHRRLARTKDHILYIAFTHPYSSQVETVTLP